ncbi:unnamed protein product [Lactuca saligna]|uniref:Uncharacterized protein n=1 Tax=Lactuca saligna TaxID=75948 RepID=A0AA35ZU21_LACSI|nr:unnamed protein product [Lactuca saligna]
MNELKDSFKNKFISNTFVNQSLIDEYCVTDSNGVTECNIEITGIDPTSYPAHLERPTPLTENIIAFPISNGVFHAVHEQLKHYPDCSVAVHKSKSDIDVSSLSITDQSSSDTKFNCNSMSNKRTQSSLGESFKSEWVKSRNLLTKKNFAHSPSIFQELLSYPSDEVSHTEEEAVIPDPIIPDPSPVNQGTTISTTTFLSDADETLESENSPVTDVPFIDNSSASNSFESAPEHRDHPVDQIIGNLHDGVQTKSRVSNNFCIVIPAPNSPPLPIYIKATNVIFNPDIPDVHHGLGIDDFVNFLVSCRLRYAISEVPSEVFPEQVCEFYYTATFNNENNIISGTIGHGRRSVFINADLLRTALGLPIFEPFSELPTIECCRNFFDQLGYDHSKAGHKSCSGDQLSAFEQQVVCSLLLNKHVDYGAFFFDKLVQLLRANVRADHVPFPRWIALVLDKFHAEAYYLDAGTPIQCPRMSVRMYQDDPLANDIDISDRMREWIVNPYTVPSVNADTDKGAADNDKIRAKIQAEIQDGGRISSQLSHHTISVTERVHSAHGEPYAQGEQPS